MQKNRSEAAAYFEQGYNCAQSVILSLAPRLNLPMDVARNIASGFGGGMGMQKTCGAVSAAYMVMGLHVGSQLERSEQERKRKLSQFMNTFNEQFRNRFGALSCRTLTGEDFTTLDKSLDKDKLDQIHEDCTQFVVGAVDILEDLFSKA